MCFNFIRGSCEHGASCRFSHDMDAYLVDRPADLVGTCPFVHQPKCPYGIACRWAGTHPHPDPATQHLIDDLAQKAAAAPGACCLFSPLTAAFGSKLSGADTPAPVQVLRRQ